jgi:hypothetical protein
MTNNYRRYEILLPLKFNDGQPVPENLLAETLLEIEQRLGPVSFESQEILGVWQHNGKTYRDKQARVFVDVEDTPANRQFFVDLKERLKQRFQQLDIWVTTHALDVV